MRGVSLDDDGTAGRERGGVVSPPGTEKREGEVRTAKDRDDADRRTHPAKVGQRSHG